MVSSVSSSHASSSEGLGSSDGAAPKRSRSAPLSPGGGFESEKNATSHAYRAYAFAAATAPGGGRVEAAGGEASLLTEVAAPVRPVLERYLAARKELEEALAEALVEHVSTSSS